MTRHMSLSQVMTFGDQIGVGKVNSGSYEYFGVVGFNVTSLDEPPSAVQVSNMGQPEDSRLTRKIA